MKSLGIVLVASFVGGIIGSLTSVYSARAQPAPSEMRVTRLVLVDQRNRPAATLGLVDGETVLQFYNKDSSVALRLGVDGESKFKFLQFLGADSQHALAALNSLGNGDTTLYLGDLKWNGRIILGAQHTDDATDKPTDSWGLVFRDRSIFPSFSALMGKRDTGKAPAEIQLIRENGEKWSVR